MDSKEKCEEIINIFNGHNLQGAKDALLVKFADGGNKKRSMYRPNQPMWRDGSEVSNSSIQLAWPFPGHSYQFLFYF